MENDFIRSEKVEDTFLATDRKLFVPEREVQHAYDDRPLKIGENSTVSAPHIVAEITELADIQGDKEAWRSVPAPATSCRF